MPRYLPSGVAAELDLSALTMGLLCELTLASGPLYLYSGFGNIEYNGNTYLGVGTFGVVGTVQEDTSVIAQGMSIGLEAVPPQADQQNALADALQDINQGQPCTLLVVLLSGYQQVVGAPIAAYAGLTDAVSVRHNPDGTCSLTLALENRLTQLQRGREYRWTNAQMQELYPGEQGFIYTANLQNYVALWGDSNF